MKTLLTARFAILLTCSLLLSVHSSAQSPAVPIQDFFKSYFEENLKDEPENATGVGRHDYDDRWSDLSKAAATRISLISARASPTSTSTISQNSPSRTSSALAC